MLGLIPRPLHRAALRLAHAVRHHVRRLARFPLAGVSVIARDEAGRVLLVRHSYGPPAWMLPGGGLRRGEAPEEAARRELREEVACGLTEIERVAELEETISGAPHTAYVLAAKAEGAPRPDRREVIEARFFALDALPDDLGTLSRQRLEAWRHSSES